MTLADVGTNTPALIPRSEVAETKLIIVVNEKNSCRRPIVPLRFSIGLVVLRVRSSVPLGRSRWKVKEVATHSLNSVRKNLGYLQWLIHVLLKLMMRCIIAVMDTITL